MRNGERLVPIPITSHDGSREREHGRAQNPEPWEPGSLSRRRVRLPSWSSLPNSLWCPLPVSSCQRQPTSTCQRRRALVTASKNTSRCYVFVCLCFSFVPSPSLELAPPTTDRSLCAPYDKLRTVCGQRVSKGPRPRRPFLFLYEVVGLLQLLLAKVI